MRPLDGDAAMLLRAGERCNALALELHGLEKALGGAADSTAARWSGAAAASFGAIAHAHRGTLQGARAAVERLGSLASTFGHDLADAQAQARRLPEGASAERAAIEDRITLLRQRFEQQSMHIGSDLKRLLLRRPVAPPRWVGPIRPPAGWGGDWPHKAPPLGGPRRAPGDWPFEPPPLSGPERVPGEWPPHWPLRPPPLGGPRPVPAPVEQAPGAAQLPWKRPGLNGSGDGSGRTLVQPVKVGA